MLISRRTTQKNSTRLASWGSPVKTTRPLNPAAGIPYERPTDARIDEFGRILTENGPGGSSTTYVQSGAGPTSITVAASPANRTTTIEYHTENDARKGKVKKITDPRQGETVLTYTTATGDLATVADPLGNTTTFAYDELAIVANRGLPTSVTDARDNALRVIACEHICADLDGLGPLSRGAQGDARDLHDAGLFLKAAGVGEDTCRVAL